MNRFIQNEIVNIYNEREYVLELLYKKYTKND